MKTSLSLVLVGASLALCNCQQQTQNTSSAAPVAPPIRVVAEKNEITPVTIGGGLAPASIVGQKEISLWESGSSDASFRIAFNNGTVGKEINDNTTYTYTKTGSKTALLSGAGKVFKLTFTNSTKGKVNGPDRMTSFIIEAL